MNCAAVDLAITHLIDILCKVNIIDYTVNLA